MNRVLALCVLLLSAPVVLADDDAMKIVDKAIKAIGRTDKDKITAVSWKGKGTYYGMGNELAYTGNWATQYPDKSRMEIENAFIIVFNGDKGWVSAGGNVMDMTKEQV